MTKPDTSFSDVVKKMKQYEASAGRLPDKAYATETFIKSIPLQQNELVSDANATLPKGAFMLLCGMPVYISNVLPRGVLCMFMKKKQMNAEAMGLGYPSLEYDVPCGMIVDDTYVPPKPIEPPSLEEAIKDMPREY